MQVKKACLKLYDDELCAQTLYIIGIFIDSAIVYSSVRIISIVCRFQNI